MDGHLGGSGRNPDPGAGRPQEGPRGGLILAPWEDPPPLDLSDEYIDRCRSFRGPLGAAIKNAVRQYNVLEREAVGRGFDTDAWMEAVSVSRGAYADSEEYYRTWKREE